MDNQGVEQDVRTLRKDTLVDLERKVDIAFQNKKKVEFIKGANGEYTCKEVIDEARNHADKIRESLKNNTPLSLSGGIGSDTTYVTNSHDFRDLLIMAYKRIGMDTGTAKESVEIDLQHEYAHHVPVLGQEEIDIKYCVSFFYDPKMNANGLRPSINISGKTDFKTLDRFFSAPKNPSNADAVINRGFKLSLPLKIIKQDNNK